MTESDERCFRVLGRIRRLRCLLLAVLISYLPLVWMLTLLEVSFAGVATVCAVLVGVGIVIGFMLGAARCPACGGLFHVKGASGHLFVSRCVHCGRAVRGE